MAETPKATAVEMNTFPGRDDEGAGEREVWANEGCLPEQAPELKGNSERISTGKVDVKPMNDVQGGTTSVAAEIRKAAGLDQ